MEILVVGVDAQRYGVPLAAVREIVRAVAITRLSGAPAVIAGIINVRGNVVPVVDLRGRFRLPPKPGAPSDHFVIARTAKRTVALHVDRAEGLAAVASSEVENAKELGPASEYLAGVAKLADELVLIYDLAAFLSQAESEALDRSLAASTAVPDEAK